MTINEDIAELKQDIEKLWRRFHDLSELRYETHQNEGCTRAKVENDILPEITRLCARLNKMDSHLADFMLETEKHHQDAVNGFNAVLSEHIKRIEKLEADLAEAMKMEWTSTPLNNLAVQYCNLTSMVKEMRDELHRLQQSREAHSCSNKELFERIERIEAEGENPDISTLTKYQREMAEWIGNQKKRIDKLEKYFSSTEDLAKGFHLVAHKEHEDSYFDLSAMCEKIDELESHQKCNSEKDGAIGAMENETYPSEFQVSETGVKTSCLKCHHKVCSVKSGTIITHVGWRAICDECLDEILNSCKDEHDE